LVASLLTRLLSRRLLIVVGASGSGKSSLVRAGVVASLQRGSVPGSDGWSIRILTPGEEPLAALASAGGVEGDSGVTRVVVVDQMEELFTACRNPSARASFVDVLLDAVENPDHGTLVIGALRADFYGHCASIPRLATALSDSAVLLGPMDEPD